MFDKKSHFYLLYLLFFVFPLCIFQPLTAQTPAFPGADGGGKFCTGGRGGKVLYVTSLADDGSVGTLRWAVNQTGARIVMFRVSGLITLKSALKISNGNITIAGQTAPGDGICLKNYEFYIGADNVIIRYLRFRLGNEIIGNESDAIWGRYQKNIILDHCSMSWSIDECASFYSNENFSMQWCIIAESLNNAGHVKGAHGYGGIWGGKNASFHHNLIAHHNSRNPRFNGWKRSGLSYTNPLDEERLDFRNNVIYDFGDNGSYGGEAAGKYNIVANYIKYGPATKTSIKYKITQVDIDPSTAYGLQSGTYYIQDNFVYGSTTNTQSNWSGVTYAAGVNTTLCKTDVPFQCIPVAQHSAETAFEKVLENAGASLARDAVDSRIVDETRNGTATYTGSVTLRPGIIDTQNDVGGWPEYNSTVAPPDTNSDGIPDGWLENYYPGKSANDLNPDGYTFLEVYINSLVKNITDRQNEGAVVAGVHLPVSPVRSEIYATLNYNSASIHIQSDQIIKKLYVRDITGKSIGIYIANVLNYEIDASGLKPGIYIISVINLQNEIKTIKFAF